MDEYDLFLQYLVRYACIYVGCVNFVNLVMEFVLDKLAIETQFAIDCEFT